MASTKVDRSDVTLALGGLVETATGTQSGPFALFPDLPGFESEFSSFLRIHHDPIALLPPRNDPVLFPKR